MVKIAKVVIIPVRDVLVVQDVQKHALPHVVLDVEQIVLVDVDKLVKMDVQDVRNAPVGVILLVQQTVVLLVQDAVVHVQTVLVAHQAVKDVPHVVYYYLYGRLCIRM